MNIKAATADRLLSDTALTAIVGTKIYRHSLPRTLSAPYIIISTMAINEHYSHEGDAGLREAYLRVSCYAKQPDEADTIAELVKARMKSWADVEDVFIEDETDVTDERRGAPNTGAELAHTALDIKVSYTA